MIQPMIKGREQQEGIKSVLVTQWYQAPKSRSVSKLTHPTYRAAMPNLSRNGVLLQLMRMVTVTVLA